MDKERQRKMILQLQDAIIRMQARVGRLTCQMETHWEILEGLVGSQESTESAGVSARGEKLRAGRIPSLWESDDDENEVTPKMIKAGIEALGSYDRDFDHPADTVRGIYRAMERARCEDT